MENNEIIESENNVEVADQHEVLEDTLDTADETVETTEETTVEDSETSETEVEETQPKQSESDNRAARLARKQAEKEAEAKIEKIRKEAYEQGLKQGKIDGFIGKQNPYTGKIIQDEIDVQEYQDMFELDSQGKDPLKDYRELQKHKAREDAKKQLKIDEELKQKQWYENDAKAFTDKYGDDKLQELMKDADFDMFATGKIGVQPLAQIYENYTAFINKYKKDSIETAKRIVANNTATPGAINDEEHQTMDWETMSKENFDKYLEKAKRGELR